jgi:hypothetical protein
MSDNHAPDKQYLPSMVDPTIAESLYFCSSWSPVTHQDGTSGLRPVWLDIEFEFEFSLSLVWSSRPGPIHMGERNIDAGAAEKALQCAQTQTSSAALTTNPGITPSSEPRSSINFAGAAVMTAALQADP